MNHEKIIFLNYKKNENFFYNFDFFFKMEGYQQNMFYYNKKTFLSMNKFQKLKFTKEFINNLVSKLHLLTISKLSCATGSEIVHYLYSDGSLTRGVKREYMDSNHIDYISYEIISPCSFFYFPCIGQSMEDTYAILTLDQSYKIINIINELFLEI